MDYVLGLCHNHSTGVSGCFGLFLFSFLFFFSYLKFNVVYRMGVLRVLIVDTGVDDTRYQGVGGHCSALIFFCALAMPWSLRTALWNID